MRGLAHRAFPHTWWVLVGYENVGAVECVMNDTTEQEPEQWYKEQDGFETFVHGEGLVVIVVGGMRPASRLVQGAGEA